MHSLPDAEGRFQGDCSDIIGVVGDLDQQAAKALHTVATRSNYSTVLISAITPTTYLPLAGLSLPNVFDMNPLIHYVEAISAFTAQWKWTRVALISDIDAYYGFMAELLQQRMDKSGKTVAPHIGVYSNHSVLQALQTLQEYNTQIVIVSVRKSLACSLLVEAERLGFVWPEYGWVVIDSATGANYIQIECKHEGVITVMDLSVKQLDAQSAGEMPDILLDAVSIVREGGRISDTAFRTGPLKFRDGNRLNNISFLQVLDGSESEIAVYNSETMELSVRLNITENDSPRGSVLIIGAENTLQHTLLFATITVLCFVGVTVILILYIFFRNEPDIKATSVPISLSMFLGCYLQLAFVVPVLLKGYPNSRVAVPHSVTCHFIAWLGGTGVPFPLILATILVKMLRVYALILKPISYKKKFVRNRALLFYILVLISPNIFILILWSVLDPLVIVQVTAATRSAIMVVEFCLSNQTAVLLAVSYVYTAILCLAVIVIVIATSAVRQKYFNDTNATNIFAIVAISIAVMGTLYGYLLIVIQPSADNYIASEITLIVSNISIAMLCQFFLFVPKVYSATVRWLFQDKVKSK